MPTLRLGGRIYLYLDLDRLGDLVVAATAQVMPEQPPERRARLRPATLRPGGTPSLDDLYSEVTGKKRKE